MADRASTSGKAVPSGHGAWNTHVVVRVDPAYEAQARSRMGDPVRTDGEGVVFATSTHTSKLRDDETVLITIEYDLVAAGIPYGSWKILWDESDY